MTDYATSLQREGIEPRDRTKDDANKGSGEIEGKWRDWVRRENKKATTPVRFELTRANPAATIDVIASDRLKTTRPKCLSTRPGMVICMLYTPKFWIIAHADKLLRTTRR